MLCLGYTNILSSQLSVSTKLNVTEGGVLSVTNRSLINFPDGNVKNAGLVYVDHNIENYDSISGFSANTGLFMLGRNWVNNGVFICDSSTVDFFGNKQFIKGGSITTFYNLLLNGNGVKTQEINAETSLLDLTINELATEQYTMEILSLNPNAISRINGFVSSLTDGHLKRNVNQASDYLFPVGSSRNNVVLYRPIVIKPTNTNLNIFGVRLAHENASYDGYYFNQVSNKLQNFNEKFYHHIYNDQQTNNGDISFFYKPTEDGLYKNIGHWENNIWEGPYNEISTANSLFEIMTANNVSNYDTRAFVLANRVDDVFIPNAFTPDGDGINDLFAVSIDAENYTDFKFMIFNRWGELIFESENPDFLWNGTHKEVNCPIGVYPWVASYTQLGSTKNELKRGHVTIVR
jgi:gliding motility-associated-like protein